jgi:ribosomal protein S8
MLGFNKLLAAVNTASNKRPSVILYKKCYLPVLDLLVTNGVILGFNIIGNFLVIRGRYLSASKLKSSKSLNFNLPLLRGLQMREGGVSVYLLSTDQGFCGGSRAISQHVGGKLVTKLF